MTVIKFKNFTNLSEDEKLLVLKWRNSDRVRLKMLNQDIISLENHLKFIDSLKSRKDCKYWLFIIDDRPIGVYDVVDINDIGFGVGGSYIGDENYLGYGLLLGYLTLEKAYELGYLANNIPNKKDCIYVMKNNKRTYLMHKNIFGAKDLCEDDEKWYLYWTKDGWEKVKDNLRETIYEPLGIEKVVWEN